MANSKKKVKLKEKIVLITIVSILSSFLVVNAQKSITYTTPVTLHVKDIAIDELFMDIHNQTNLNFIYNRKDFQSFDKINLDVDQVNVQDVMHQLFDDKGFQFKIVQNSIIIEKNHLQLHGIIYDAKTRDPIIGATVRIKGGKNGVATNINGEFYLDLISGNTIVISSIGYDIMEKTIRKDNDKIKSFFLVPNAQNLNEVVVTGIFNKPRASYTGAATSFSQKELEVSGNRSLISSLRNLDPSFSIADNITVGSDPNSLPSITLRGPSSLPTDVKDLQVSTDNQREANQPLFILDGFEISLSRFMDMDESQIENITLLKDANATAMYGSKGSNGVVVITSKRIAPGKLRISYKGTLNVEAPDLSSYNLMNSTEKLEYEKVAGLYESSNAIYDQELKDLYNQRKTNVERGVNTYWLKYPVRTGIGSRHYISAEGGDENLRYGADLSYNDVEGAMKGSNRKVLDGSMSLLYKYKNISFQNRLEVTNTKSFNSPYGSFSDYCALNSYYTPYDNSGNLNKILEDYFYQSLQSTNKVYNPLFNANLPSKNTNSYTDITNNCAIEWYIIPELFLRGQFSFTKEFTRSDIYIPADNTMFDSYTGDDYSRKGRYTYGSGESMQYNGRLTLNYTKNFGKHQLFGGFGLTIDQSKSESYTIIGEGLSINKMDFLGMSKQYMEGTTPTGTESISRDFGLLCNLQYTYNQQYFIDLNGKYDGSSQFGSNNHFAPFWSTGIGWNIHNEEFMKEYKWIDIARLRASYGITGSQNFASYLGMRTYQLYSGQSTQNWYGVYLLAYGNPDLKWQTTSQMNLGFDLELFNHRLVVNFDWYNKLTHDLLADVNLPLSSGFSSYKDNIGTVRNKGYEVSLSAQIIRDTRNKFYWTVGLKAARNINRIEKISNSLQKLNDELTSESSYNPSFLYKEGQSLNTIYAVRSKGIDPSTGKEIYIKSDGTETFIWNAKDEVPCGVAEPKIQGNINTNVRWKGLSLNVICGFRLGGYAYNSTLANKVENINPYDNADRRALYDRWKEPGDLVKFKSVTDFTPTYATSRFIFKDNTFYGSSLNLGYEFPQKWIKKHLSVSYLAINGYMEDLFWLSTIKRERGTDYPFSRKFSFSLTIRF